jgi:hypothetical protein
MELYQDTIEALNIDETYHGYLEDSPSDIALEMLGLTESIELLHWLVQPASVRGYAADKDRDTSGRIKVNITKPHILEDMDYFRQPAISFQKTGKYTNLYPNRHPNSEYYKFWNEEAKRCLEGYVRESDGEWITGYYYWYLNYSPIMRTVDILDAEGNATGRGSREYNFPDVWDSDYMFFHYVEQAEEKGLFGTILKTRGRGYSFKTASMLARNFFLIPKSKSFAFASDSEYLEDDGLLNNKTWDVLDWVDEHTAWNKNRTIDRINQKKAGYRDPTDNKEKGFKSEIIGVTTGGNPEKGRGKRGKLLVYEEGGMFPHLLKTWVIARPSMEDGPTTFGFMMAFGTGGTEGANFEGIEELFYRGQAYRVHMIPNVFDKVKGNGECAFFVPEYMNRKDCYDKNGNSDPYKALWQVLKDRKIIRENASKSDALTQEKAERPFTPQEAVLRFEGTIFPVADLKTTLEDIMPRMDSFINEHYIGDLVTDPDTGLLSFKPNADARVLREFPVKDNKNKEGAFEIFRLPIVAPNGSIPRFRYIAGIDTYDDDESGTNSLGSIQILDMLTDEIVAEYTGRPPSANAFFEKCWKLLTFYNAVGNYESNKKGLFNFFQHRHALSLLAPVPEILKDMEMIKGTNLGGNKAYGTNANPRINAWGRRLQADYMVEPIMSDLGNGEENTGLLKLHRLRGIAYIKECIGWNEDGNFDRVSSGGMLMILREEYKKYIYYVKDEYNKDTKPDLSQDPFFSLNFDKSSRELNDLEKSVLKEINYKHSINLREI